MTTSQENEHRIETRVDKQETIFIEILSSSTESDGSVVMCTTLDLSANGLQVIVDNEIDVNSILRLCVDLPNMDPLFLVAEVKWKRADPENEGFRLGFLLFETEDSDIVDWKLWIADMLDFNNY